jgi:hypothetical protein
VEIKDDITLERRRVLSGKRTRKMLKNLRVSSSGKKIEEGETKTEPVKKLKN